MKQIICLFEDRSYTNLLPLVYLRPVYDLRCGILTLREKISLQFPAAKIVLHSRSYLQDVLNERYSNIPINRFEGDSILFINGRFLINIAIVKQLIKLKEDHILRSGKDIVAAKISGNNLYNLFKDKSEFFDFDSLNDIKNLEIEAKLMNYPWNLINENGQEIINDYYLLAKKFRRTVNYIKHRSSELINKKSIHIGKGTKIDPFVLLDATEGPIYIGNNVRIMSHASIQGPVFIGDNSEIKMHSSIYQNTSIGEVCKVGGEVDNSIIHSYSNKQHEGFLGHSYLGSWINIGASTNNSDLKNNYGLVDVYINNKPVNSGTQFVGLIMGDHSKTAINTMFNTGTVVGVSCNIFGAGFPHRYLPSFTWGGSELMRTYTFNKASEIARIVMNRRNVLFTKCEKDLLKKVFELTAEERSDKK